MIRGLDASECQGALVFPPDLRFVILKAQQGNDGFDPYFEANLRAALAAGLEPFAYCFAYPLPHLDSKAQAKLFVDRVYRFPEMRGRPIFLDYEWPAPAAWARWKCTAAQLSAWCRSLAEEIQRLTGIPPILYTYPDWWEHVSAADVSWAAKFSLWLAAYVKAWPEEGDGPKMPAPWQSWLFWQWDGDGGAHLPNGVDADFCVFNGDEEALGALAHQPMPIDFEIVYPLPDTV